MRISEMLFGDAPAVFRSDLPIEESVQRLSAGVADLRGLSILRVHEGQRVFGRVSSDRVRLAWVTPFNRNIFHPWFVGHFEPVDAGSLLVGKFTVGAIAKAWACLFVAMGALGVVVAIGHASVQPLWLSLPVSVGISVAGFVALRISQRLTRRIRKNLTDFVTFSLSSEKANDSFKPRPLRGSA